VSDEGRDLANWLAARASKLVSALPGLAGLRVARTPHGVGVTVETTTQSVRLEVLPPADGQVFARLPSGRVVLAHDGTVAPAAERVVTSFVALLRRLDRGDFKVRGVDAMREAAALVSSGAQDAPATPARSLDALALACRADRVALLASWGLPPGEVLLLAGDPRTPPSVRAEVLDTAWDAVHLLWASPASSHDVAATVARARLGGTARVTVTVPAELGHHHHGADAVVSLGVPKHAPPGVPLTVALRFGGVEAELAAAAAEARASLAAAVALGARAVVLPGEVPPPWPLLADVASSVAAALAGAPVCVAPELGRADAPGLAALSFPEGGRFARACDLCARATACPGIDERTYRRYGTLGIVPILEEGASASGSRGA
jgi:hypothetical protein